MPEHTAFTVCNGSVFCGLNRFSYGKILMVAGKNFECIDTLVRETNEILDNIEQSFFLEHTLKESIELSILRIFIVSVFGFPLLKGDGPLVTTTLELGDLGSSLGLVALGKFLLLSRS